MALSVGNKRVSSSVIGKNDLEIEKLLVWKTKIPFETEEWQSSSFSLMGLDWCLQFSYSEYVYYHVITLHQVINGVVQNDLLTLKNVFNSKTFLMHPTSLGAEEIGVRTENVTFSKKILWYAGSKKTDIYNSLPSLYDRCEVKVVCKFYGQPLSTFQLQLKTGNNNILPNQVRSVNRSVQVSSEVPRDIETLSSDLSHLLEKEILPDVKLECGGQTFQAHRSILAARSQVFRAMFESKMLESETGAVKVQDLDVGVLEKLLKFIYSGKPDDLSEENTSHLYEAADKYDVVSLKSACSYWMVRNLTEENCIGFLQVANIHSDPDLKAAVTSFIVENPSVMISASWLSLSKELSCLASEVQQAYIASTLGTPHVRLPGTFKFGCP